MRESLFRFPPPQPLPSQDVCLPYDPLAFSRVFVTQVDFIFFPKNNTVGCGPFASLPSCLFSPRFGRKDFRSSVVFFVFFHHFFLPFFVARSEETGSFSSRGFVQYFRGVSRECTACCRCLYLSSFFSINFLSGDPPECPSRSFFFVAECSGEGPLFWPGFGQWSFNVGSRIVFRQRLAFPSCLKEVIFFFVSFRMLFFETRTVSGLVPQFPSSAFGSVFFPRTVDFTITCLRMKLLPTQDPASCIFLFVSGKPGDALDVKPSAVFHSSSYLFLFSISLFFVFYEMQEPPTARAA